MSVPPQPSPALEHLLTVWQKVIDLQMHFNEMCMNLRRTAVTVLGVLLAAGALAFRFGGAITVASREVSVAFVFALVALVVWCCFYAIDRFWYHEMLRASVAYAEELEGSAHSAGLPVKLDVSKRIRDQNRKALRLSGAAKLNWFYGLVALVLLVALALLLCGAVRPTVGT